MDIYREKMLDHYNNPRNFGGFIDGNATIKLENLSCGDSIEMQVSIEDGKLKEVRFQGEGCAVAIASASILTQYAKGKKVSEIAKIDLEKVQELLGVQLTLSRLKCANLGLETLKKCVVQELANK